MEMLEDRLGIWGRLVDLAQGDGALQEGEVVFLIQQHRSPILDRHALHHQAGGGAYEVVGVVQQRPHGRQRRREVATDQRLTGPAAHQRVFVH